MNNLLKIVVLFFASIILFTSCKTMSVTKRHYNKGYYVSHSHKKKVTGKVEKQESVAKVETVETIPAKKVDLGTSIVPSADEKELKATSSSEEIVVTPVKEKKRLFNRNVAQYSNEEIEVKDVIKNPMKLRNVMAAKDTGDDALSLIWILIVALLIIYIVGIIADGFGLGGLIHILGVIVLVLLILWLLKLI